MSNKGGFTIVDFTVPTRDLPVIHPSTEPPICDDCRSQDLCFFDPTCSGCQDILSNPKTSISELFAIIRQWIPQTQRHMTLLTREILRRGAHINDKDGLTDLSLLHYASKAGAVGMGNVTTAANLVNSLITKGADTDLRCHWTDMNALHYAVFFDCHEVVEQLCEHNPALVVTVCSQFDDGNALHIAAANLCYRSALILLAHGADGGHRDSSNRLPYECIPLVVPQDQQAITDELKDKLLEASLNRPSVRIKKVKSPDVTPQPRTTPHKPPSGRSHVKSPLPSSTPHTKPSISKQSMTISKPHPLKSDTDRSTADSKSSSTTRLERNTASPVGIKRSTSKTRQSPAMRSPLPQSPALSSGVASTTSGGDSADEVTLESLGVKVGERVIIDATSSKPKRGTLRFAGEFMSAAGLWAGVELDDEQGRNDGSHSGIRYFSCKPKHGIFVALKRLTKDSSQSPAVSGSHSRKRSSDKRQRTESFITSRAIEAHSQLQMSSEFQVGDRVLLSGKDPGTLCFTGAVKFAPGYWLGVELDQARGNCDGSKGGEEYFKCRPNHGIFVTHSKVTKLKEGQESGGVTLGSTATPPSRRRRTPATPPSTGLRTRALPRSKSKPSYISPISSSLSLASGSLPTLEKGMSVFVNKEKGTVQFIGSTEFAPGMWLGIELRTPTGKNDGSVHGKRYFTCKLNHGIFSRPEKCTHRGINCAKLLKQDKPHS